MTDRGMSLCEFLRRVRKYPRIYGETWFRFLRPRLLWSEVYRGVQWASWWVGWTNPVYKRKGW